MPTYRVFFRQQYRVVGRDEFSAEDDVIAFSVAHEIWSASRDVCDWFEVWRGRQLVRRYQTVQSQTDGLQEKIEEAVAEREMVLQQSRWRIATSRQLLARFEKLHGTQHAPAARRSLAPTHS